ncbi:acylphosphatase [Geodermatophilus pulveris]|uniref:acylphosphatase n=1 Tax=Geodermatophilus pulveris TaxID=1564159 RepID=A0A239BDW9_9ACTN|nr:acylphosphatase [Geodermatophilus pulveris]
MQGVGYRWFVRGRATAADLAGSATNLPDGRVEVVLEGPDAAVAAVLADLDGPRAPGAVTSVDVRDEPVQGVRGFTTT